MRPSPLSRPNLQTALLINQAPMAVFAIGIVLVTLLLLIAIDAQLAEVVAAHGAGELSAADLEQIARGIRTVWLGSLGGFLFFLSVVSGLSFWVYRRVSRRVDDVVAYAERRMAGEPVNALPSQGDDVMARLERAIMEVSEQSAEKTAALQRESAHGRSSAQLQRAFELAGTEAQALDIVHRALGEYLPGHDAQVLMADSSQAHLRPMVGSADGCSVASPAECAAVRRGAPLVFESSETLDACPMLRDREAACSAVCSPLTVMGRTVGVLHVSGADGSPPDEVQRRVITAVANHSGNRLSVLRTLAGAQLQASTDPLTGLLNRRSFEDAASRVLNERGAETHSLVMCDLDHFKRLNDTAGHQAGDRALKLFARVLKGTLRGEDIIGRHGGEEFVLMLPGCDGQNGARLVERLREALAKESAHYEGPPFTCSFGLACSGNELDVPELVRSADRALYAAKNDGRDRLVLVQELRAAAGV